MGGVFSSSEPAPAVEASSVPEQSSAKAKRSKLAKKPSTEDGPDSPVKKPQSYADAAKIAERLQLPIKLEQCWQESERIAALAKKWGIDDADLPLVRSQNAPALAKAFKSLSSSSELSPSASASSEADEDHDEDDTSAEQEKKRTKRRIRRMRDAVKAAKPLSVPVVADPWGDEDPSFLRKWLDERVTGLMIVLDGLRLKEFEELRDQRLQMIRCLEKMSANGRTWAAAKASSKPPTTTTAAPPKKKTPTTTKGEPLAVPVGVTALPTKPSRQPVARSEKAGVSVAKAAEDDGWHVALPRSQRRKRGHAGDE